MRFFFVLSAALIASVTALPQMWLTSSLNAKKTCIVPIGYTPPPGAMMDVTSPVVDAKNGVHCHIAYNNATKTITVTSDVGPGILLNVSAGTLANGVGAKKSCAYAVGNGPHTFTWVPAAGGKASATCGDDRIAVMYTTMNIPLA